MRYELCRDYDYILLFVLFFISFTLSYPWMLRFNTHVLWALLVSVCVSRLRMWTASKQQSCISREVYFVLVCLQHQNQDFHAGERSHSHPFAILTDVIMRRVLCTFKMRWLFAYQWCLSDKFRCWQIQWNFLVCSIALAPPASLSSTLGTNCLLAWTYF